MVDGVSGTDLYRVIFDATAAPSPPAADHRTVSAEPSDLALAADAAVDIALIPLRESRALRDALGHPGQAVRQAADVWRGLTTMARSAWPTTASSLTGPIGRQPRDLSRRGRR